MRQPIWLRRRNFNINNGSGALVNGGHDDDHELFRSSRHAPYSSFAASQLLLPTRISANHFVYPNVAANQPWFDTTGHASHASRVVVMRNVDRDADVEMLNLTQPEDVTMTDPEEDDMVVDPPTFDASIVSDDFMPTIVVLDAGQETAAINTVEVRLEDELDISSNVADASPNAGNNAFLASISSFVPSLIGRPTSDEKEEVVPYDWGTPCVNGGLFAKDPATECMTAYESSGYDYKRRLHEAYLEASSSLPLSSKNSPNGTEEAWSQPSGLVLKIPAAAFSFERKGKRKQCVVNIPSPDDSPMAPAVFYGWPSPIKDAHDLGGANPDTPCRAAQQLAAFLYRDGSPTSYDEGHRKGNVFTSDSFQRRYLSAFDRESPYHHFLHRPKDNAGLECLQEFRENGARPLRHEPGARHRLPRTPVRDLEDGTNGWSTSPTPGHEMMSPLIGSNPSDDDPFATSSGPPPVEELRYKNIPVPDLQSRLDYYPPSPTRQAHSFEPKPELNFKKPPPPLSLPPRAKEGIEPLAEQQQDIEAKNPLVKPKQRICNPHAKQDLPPRSAATLEEVPQVEGKLLLWRPLPQKPKVSPIVPALPTPPPTPPHLPRESKRKKKNKSSTPEPPLGCLDEGLVEVGALLMAAQKNSELVTTDKPDNRKRKDFPGAYPLDTSSRSLDFVCGW